MEELWVQSRLKLQTLLNTQRNYSTRELMAETGRSETWVHKWKVRLLNTDQADATQLHSRSRRPKRLPEPVDPQIEAAILAARKTPPAQLGRTPGARYIQAHLKQDTEILKAGLKIPGRTKIWQVLDQNHCILRHSTPPHTVFERPAPMVEWEVDFATVDTAMPELDGKRKNVVELFNFVDRGTSILVDSIPDKDYNEERALITIVDVLMREGLPQILWMDRDPRFVGSWGMDGFPSALVRCLLCLGVRVKVCPPRRPDLKPFVERFNKTIKYELILVRKPTNVDETLKVLKPYKPFFNNERPHQGDVCNDLPPRVAFPNLPTLPRLPDKVDGDSWLTAFHNQYFKRRVSSSGIVVVDKDKYYVGKPFAGQYVLLRLDAQARVFHVEASGKLIKDLPLKCLLGGMMTFDEYFDLMCKEARSEVRRLEMAAQQRRWRSQQAA